MDQLITFITNHWMLSTLFVVLVIALGVNEWMSYSFGIPKISPQEAIQLINHQEAVVIDLRNETTFTTGHILGAMNIPTASIEKKLNSLQKFLSKPIILVCHAEHDTPKVAAQLNKQGFKVFLIQGGLQEWRRSGLPLVKK